jgi:hypothetical protein
VHELGVSVHRRTENTTRSEGARDGPNGNREAMAEGNES